jgi:FAD dependent oxidoreductase TIGR03364
MSVDVAIVGAGIIGLAHAWAAAGRGLTVAVFERSRRAQGASVRNFGMIWPVGQPRGDSREIALRSRSLWIEAARRAGFWLAECGSMFLAHRLDEFAVLEEFVGRSRACGVDVRLLPRDEVVERAPGANPDGLLGGMWSPTELAVDPREAPHKLAAYLAETGGVGFHFGVAVRAIDTGSLTTADGRVLRADRIFVCGGSDFETLFPHAFPPRCLRRCKLQMLRTYPQPGGWRLGPHLASGLTLRHYESFADCGGMTALRDRIAAETPELDRYGIHVMAAQNSLGEIVLGDSHEYEDAIEPFDKAEIENLILRELRRVIRLPNWEIAARWHGIYARSVNGARFSADPLPGVRVATGVGGAGMTLSFGLAERNLEA